MSPYDALAPDERVLPLWGRPDNDPSPSWRGTAHTSKRERKKERKRAQRASSQSHEGSSIPSLDQEFASMY